MKDCADSKVYGSVTHLCVKPEGHTGAHTSGAASWGAHDWLDASDPRMSRWPSLRESMDYRMCYRCGIVERRDGQSKPCKGKMPQITLREEAGSPPRGFTPVDEGNGSA